MDDHSGNEHRHHPFVLHDEIRYHRAIPCAADLVDHVLRRLPCFLIGCSRIEVTAASEEQTGEGDEDEGLQDGPTLGNLIGDF